LGGESGWLSHQWHAAYFLAVGIYGFLIQA
jgi:hypothetical protein